MLQLIDDIHDHDEMMEVNDCTLWMIENDAPYDDNVGCCWWCAAPDDDDDWSWCCRWMVHLKMMEVNDAPYDDKDWY